MSAKKKAASEKKDIQVGVKVTRDVAQEISDMAAAHGFEDNRSKYIELAARGLITVDRKKAGLE